MTFALAQRILKLWLLTMLSCLDPTLPRTAFPCGLAAALIAAVGLGMAFPLILPADVSGENVFRERCAPCHGASGEGVPGKHARALAGNKSVSQLARFIEKSMPEDAPGTCVGEEAQAVARYIHDAFYSPIAQARNRPARIELSRLTVRQHRNALADLLGSFRPPARLGDERGLRGEYFNSRDPGNRRAIERTDPQVRLDFDGAAPYPETLSPLGFSARWKGSLIAPETGTYELMIRTDHAARLWINDPQKPLIDVWVKSGAGTEHGASVFLIGGRAYPLRLEFTSRKQGVNDEDKKKAEAKPVKAFIQLCWKPPDRVEEVIPSRHLAPDSAAETFVATTPFPPEDRSVGFERGISISRAWDEAATGAAIETAGYVIGHLEELAGAPGADPEREAKLREFCRQFVVRAFRRPMADRERQLYIDRQFAGAPDLETAVKRVVLLALKSPRFLFIELGDGPRDAYAVASRLSFALWDSPPDRPLLEAAAGGRLASRDQVALEAGRMIADPRTRSKMRQFLHHWLGMEPVPDLAKDAKRFAGFDEATASDLRTSLDLLLDDVLWDEGADFRQLLLSRELYLNGRLAKHYGYCLPSDMPFQKIDTGEMQRAGVLSHPYLMARFAYPDASSPIHRGVFVVRSLLGRVLRPPPEAFAPLPVDLHPGLTTRERVALQTRDASCQACHGTINSLGFALEHFDAIGRYRDEEGGTPIDASGSFEPRSGGTLTFNGVRELAEILATSEEAHGAFVAQLFHHLVKQPILAYGPEAPGDLRRAFRASELNIRKLLVEIASRSALEGVPEREKQELLRAF